MNMKINNLDELIIDFEAIFDITLSASNIVYDIKLVMANKDFREGDIFRVIDSKTTLNFEMTEKTGEKQVITYLGCSKFLKDEKNENESK